MDTLLIFVTLLAAAASRTVPDTDYEPSKELLEMIFGKDTETRTKSSAVQSPDTIFFEDTVRPCQKSSNSVTPETVDPNIKVNDYDKRRVSVDDSVKVNNKTSQVTGAGTNTGKQDPARDVPDIHSRFVEDLSLAGDRVFLRGDECPSDKVRFGDKCVAPD